MLPARWWAVWLACGVVATVAYPLLPFGWAPVVLSGLISTGSAATIVVFARRSRTAAAWYLFAAGLIVWIVGDVAYARQSMSGATAYPALSDYCYLAAVPVMAVALFRLTRERGSLWSGTLVDSAIIAVAVGIVYWALVIEPILSDEATPLPARLATAGSPTVGVLLCAVIVPILLRHGHRTASLWMLTAGSGITLALNVVWTLVPGVPAQLMPFLYSGYLLAYALWAAAAAHPSPVTTVAAEGDRLGRSRLVVLTGSMLLVPALLIVQGERGEVQSSWFAVAVGSMALFVLVATRLSGYIGRVDKQARQLRDQATHDDLTGLPNRREFERRATAAVAVEPGQVMMLDLAGFKHINDRLGRATGDQALVAVAGLLRDAVRDGDLVARMGADEFAVLVRDTRPGEADAVAARLADLVRRPVHAGEHELLLSARVGVSSGTGVPAAELVRRADTARYAAKAAGGHVVVYSAGLDEQAEAAERLGADLRHSLEDGDFHVVYQPIVRLSDTRTVAFEALVRWNHPVRGFVSPVAFIPVAEDNGLIVELGEWVMRTACHQLAAWRRDLGPAAPGYISVNVSARQLSEPGFAPVVTGILAENGLEPRSLLVEVTETAIFGGGVAIEAVEALHEAGVLIALDDFGTGHSSLGLLRTVPVDVLKVDKSFVDEISESPGRAVIVDALIHVSNGLGLRAVAEGVETAEQAAYLRSLGYQYGQGYYFGKPVPTPGFTDDQPSIVSGTSRGGGG
ncbi:bifunctional diguanylate cyclase/phosphodiesterase [Actinoplanes sp. LDG1-06]|uniref:Bifunctional diguanylate cyclase/phosphodiesterase n=1 Tax=Paractinoplanes ovalisporus TaxID=2810368 RepID=A0ABS2A4U9_9ACTN|nr:bifunctional diguanylate cyclase/phosphodiesterase [Actinoplanes ovalisporus]